MCRYDFQCVCVIMAMFVGVGMNVGVGGVCDCGCLWWVDFGGVGMTVWGAMLGVGVHDVGSLRESVGVGGWDGCAWCLELGMYWMRLSFLMCGVGGGVGGARLNWFVGWVW